MILLELLQNKATYFQLLFFVKIIVTNDNSIIFEPYLELIQMTNLIVGYLK